MCVFSRSRCSAISNDALPIQRQLAWEEEQRRRRAQNKEKLAQAMPAMVSNTIGHFHFCVVWLNCQISYLCLFFAGLTGMSCKRNIGREDRFQEDAETDGSYGTDGNATHLTTQLQEHAKKELGSENM